LSGKHTAFPVCDTAPPTDDQTALVQRIVASPHFARSPTLRSFLLYVAEHAIAGRLEAVKEQQIGSQVLGRRPDYDPAEDNIVRVRARQVRQKLDDYFKNEGQNEPVVITIPKGHYIPIFQTRVPDVDGETPAAASGGEDASFDVLSKSTSPNPFRHGYNLRIPAGIPWVVAAMAVSALATTLLLGRSNKPAPAPDLTTALARSFWSQMLPSKGAELTVITADAGFALWQDVTHRNLDLGSYLSRSYLREDSNPEMREIATRRCVSPSDLSVSLRVADIAQSLGGRARIQFARNANFQDLSNGNLVLLGSRRSNPWMELFEPQMNFVLGDQPSPHGPGFRNKAAKPDEPATFSIFSPLEVHGAENKAVDSYAIAALLPNPSGHGKVLIAEGLGMEGTEAAGELITNPEKFEPILRQIGLRDGAHVKSFELLLKLTALAGGYSDAKLIAYRYVAT
jgi:hypothetical protein